MRDALTHAKPQEIARRALGKGACVTHRGVVVRRAVLYRAGRGMTSPHGPTASLDACGRGGFHVHRIEGLRLDHQRVADAASDRSTSRSRRSADAMKGARSCTAAASRPPSAPIS